MSSDIGVVLYTLIDENFLCRGLVWQIPYNGRAINPRRPGVSGVELSIPERCGAGFEESSSEHVILLPLCFFQSNYVKISAFSL